jgi:hypothetical protein
MPIAEVAAGSKNVGALEKSTAMIIWSCGRVIPSCGTDNPGRRASAEQKINNRQSLKLRCGFIRVLLLFP